MQTAVDFYRQNLSAMLSTGKTQYKTEPEIYEIAKEMEKQQIIDSYQSGDGDAYNLKQTEIFAKQYYNETYGSKGSDETKQDEKGYQSECICDTECREFANVKCKKLKQSTSSQTEISDEEEWAAALKLTDNIQEHNGWEKAIKWYREQLKKK